MTSDSNQPNLVQPNEQPSVEPLVSEFPDEADVQPTSAGDLAYKTYVPTGYDESPVPLVVMLHGCLQNPTDFATGTRMNEIAERETFIVTYPKQERSRNMACCWRWFEDAQTTRDEGEVAMIADLTRRHVEDYHVDEERVFAAGLSAGAAMAANLVVAYPELYTAVCIHSGLGYDAAENQDEAVEVMDHPDRYDPQAKGSQAFESMGERSQIIPTIVFHGNQDETVDPAHGSHAAEQATQMNDLTTDERDTDVVDYEADKVVTGESDGAPISRRFTRSEYHGSRGRPLVVKYVVDEMGHAWSGGGMGGSFVDPFGPNASELAWQFFESHGEPLGPIADADTIVASVGESVSLYGGGSYDPDGNVVRYVWDLDDGTTKTGSTVTHSYDDPGEYDVTLTVEDDSGAIDTDGRRVIIEPE